MEMLTEETVRTTPPEVKFFDERADKNWAVLLKRARVIIGAIKVDFKRLYMLNNFGLPDLLFRLECQSIRESRRGGKYDAFARAKIWLHVAEATTEGEDISDLNEKNRWRLNAFLPDGLKIKDPRLVALAAEQKAARAAAKGNVVKPSRRSLEYKQAQMLKRNQGTVRTRLQHSVAC